jgi:fumarate reductase subunit C
MFVAWFVVYLLFLMKALLDGEPSYQQFLTWSATPGIVFLNLVTLAFVVYHAVTFFQAAPQAMVVHAGRRRVPPHLVLIAHYAAWFVVSAAISWWFLAT